MSTSKNKATRRGVPFLGSRLVSQACVKLRAGEPHFHLDASGAAWSDPDEGSKSDTRRGVGTTPPQPRKRKTSRRQGEAGIESGRRCASSPETCWWCHQPLPYHRWDCGAVPSPYQDARGHA